jgi:hypothetical protein
MSWRGVEGECASCTEGSCPFNVAVVTVARCVLGFVAQLMGGGVDVAVNTCSDGELGNKSAAKVQ